MTPTPSSESGPGSGTVLRFENVSHCYGARRALSGLSLMAARGETVALLGPNGAGKSTTISLMLGLLRVQAGTVEICGMSPRRAIAQGRVGAMLQTGTGSGLPPGMRVDATLRMVTNLYRHPALLDDVVERAGISSLLGRRTDRLSGGEAQRVRFALAIAGAPELVFLDEPTAAMDATAQREFWRMIGRFAEEGRTTVFATHHLREADQVADRVVVVHHGTVVADGPGATLKAAVGTRRVSFSCEAPDLATLEALEGVTDVELGPDRVSLSSMDSDATLRDLVLHGVPFGQLDIAGADMEAAYFALTEGGPQPHRGTGGPQGAG
ncbi:MAG TPA: ABC transporter ATP-binding protein [Acidimicrobiales bacterium]|nr:ABC transporter ATP-binding protein [Acidimicrobiales bacterium]